MSLSAHQSSRAKSTDYLTPGHILLPLGHFDLDPAASCSQAHRLPDPLPTSANELYCVHTDGLSKVWSGRVWLNPPFGKAAATWLRRLAEHGNGIALIPARTETKMFFESVWGVADLVLFVEGRPHFIRPDGTRSPFNSGAPICLVAYGHENARILANSGLGWPVLSRDPRTARRVIA